MPVTDKEAASSDVQPREAVINPDLEHDILSSRRSASAGAVSRLLLLRAEPVIFGRSLHTQLPILWYLYTMVGS